MVMMMMMMMMMMMVTMTLPMVVVMLITIIATVTNFSVGKMISMSTGSIAMIRQLHYDLATTTGGCTARKQPTS